MSKVIRFKDDESYSLLDMWTFVSLMIVGRTPQEDGFKYVWRSKVYGNLRYALDSSTGHQDISLNELPEFVRALIVIHDI